MSVIFNGNEFAEKIIAGLPANEGSLVVFLDPHNEAGVKYVAVKKKIADRLGVKMEVIVEGDTEILIQEKNRDASVDAIMIQLPFPDSERLIGLISPEKDIDGLREDSLFMPAAVRAVMEILKVGLDVVKIAEPKILVVGSEGEVGKRLMKQLQAKGMDKNNFDVSLIKNADVVISATGQAGLITSEMVKPGVVAIDVGYPMGDFSAGVANVAEFFTPVPGGVGPLTVAELFVNLLEKF